MLGAEAAFAAKEATLQSYLDSYESTHSYDEYVYDLDEIKHDPYVLISLLTAYHNSPWTLDEVEPTLDMLFEKQYTLTETSAQETRTRDGEEYTVTVCTVKLEKGRCRFAFENRARKAHRLLVRKDRQDLRRYGGAGGRRRENQLQAGVQSWISAWIAGSFAAPGR